MAGFFVGLINWFIKGVGSALVWLIALLPDSPFTAPATPPNAINLGWVTWIIDFPTMLQHLTLLLSAIVIYYGVRIAARWIKVARD